MNALSCGHKKYLLNQRPLLLFYLKKTLSVPGKDLLFDLSFTPSFTSAKVWA